MVALDTNVPEFVYLITDTNKQLVSDDSICSKSGTRNLYEMDRIA